MTTRQECVESLVESGGDIETETLKEKPCARWAPVLEWKRRRNDDVDVRWTVDT
jgi:hypothetical protein